MKLPKDKPIDLKAEFESIAHGTEEEEKIKNYLMSRKRFTEDDANELLKKCELRFVKKEWVDQDGTKHQQDTIVIPYKTTDGSDINYLQHIPMDEHHNLKDAIQTDNECTPLCTDGYFLVKGDDENAYMIHVSPINAMVGHRLFPAINHFAIGSPESTDKVSLLKGKNVFVAQYSDETGLRMLEEIVNILGPEVKGLQWSTPAKNAYKDVASHLIGYKKYEIDELFINARQLLRSEKNNRTFELIRLSDMKSSSSHWLVKDLAEDDSIVGIFGPSGTAKTFFIVDVCCSIVTGTDFHGMPVKKGPVIYIAGEGLNNLKKRFDACGKYKGVDMNDAEIFISNLPVGLTDEEKVKSAIKKMQKIANKVGPPAAIIIDTVSRNFGPGDENSSKDMGQFVQAIDEIRSLYGSTIFNIHHSGLNDASRARGSSVLRAALDAEFKVSLDKSKIVRVENTKMKDHSCPTPMAFKLEPVELGIDADGDPISSAVLVREKYVPLVKAKQAAGQGEKQVLVKSILTDMLNDFPLNGGITRIPIADLKAKAFEKGIDSNHWDRYHKYLTTLPNVKSDGSNYQVTC